MVHPVREPRSQLSALRKDEKLTARYNEVRPLRKGP
jgi:hypothetical protein